MHQPTFAFNAASQTLWRGTRRVCVLAAVLFGVSLSARTAVAADATLTGVGPGLSVTGRIEGGSADASCFALAAQPRTGSVTGAATRQVVPARCGDGVVNQIGEECDDGNTVNGDGCDNNCTVTRCGNGVLTAGEQCDDGNLLDGDGCDANCTPTGCGNGVVTVGEECDDGNLVNGDACDANCTLPRCGNAIVDAGEQCDDGNAINGDTCDNTCTFPGCGNGIASGAEECDDGNPVNGDGCDNNCTVTRCGNGIVSGAEECDDGNLFDGDGCDSNCTLTACGNGVVTAGELCDDGNVVNGDGCDVNCTPTGCGNGVVTAGEECDDGNGIDGDGCEGDCTLPRCGNGILDRGEQCDDGNVADGDGCSATCRLQEICLDLVDNDGNGLIDCDDPACSCLPIKKDPATIWFRSGKPGVLSLHGRIMPLTPIDPVADGLGIIVTNTNGVVFRGRLLPGDLKRVRNRFTFGDRAAAAGNGRRGGIQKIVLSKDRARYRLTLRAFGDLDAATVPVMTVQIVIGDDAFFSKGEWWRTKRGWKFEL